MEGPKDMLKSKYKPENANNTCGHKTFDHGRKTFFCLPFLRKKMPVPGVIRKYQGGGYNYPGNI
jgi:hypothetical protein